MLSKTKHQSQQKEKLKFHGNMIKEVYEDNFREEIAKLSLRLDKYRFVAMDTEFPGVVFNPTNNSREQYYKSIKKNVDCLKLIQVGITICDEEGNYPPDTATWQFNMKFDINTDQFSPESIALLTNSGINFESLASEGIPIDKFGEYLITSGLLLNEDIHWVSFHGVYDFAYLLKVITGLPLPENEYGFIENLKLFFPHYYDIRHLVRYTDNLRGSLSRLGQELNINRVGIQHQAGSDSIITSEIFFKLKEEYFSEDLILKDKNILFGLGFGEDSDFGLFSNNTGLGMSNMNNMNNILHNKVNSTGNINQLYSENTFTNPNPPTFYSQNLMGMPYTYIQQPRTTLSSNTTPFYPHNMPTMSPYHFAYPQNGMNSLPGLNGLSYTTNYNIGMNNLNINNNMPNLNEEKKKF